MAGTVSVRSICGILATTLLSVSTSVFADPIRGAGSTFVAPLISKWSKNYEETRADGGDYFTLDWSVDYEPVGSLAGVMRLQEPEMDFAATDAPLSGPEVSKRGYAQFPVAMGAIVVVANMKGADVASIRLSGPVLADIFSGKVRKWSDEAITALNPASKLPDREISVLHRKDGSGSTLIFTSYLSSADPDWHQRFGAATLIDWEVGVGVDGTQDLIALATSTENSITCAEAGQAARAGLVAIQLQNQSGNFVLPSAENIQAGFASVVWVRSSISLQAPPTCQAAPPTRWRRSRMP